jgi:hypothetical protein
MIFQMTNEIALPRYRLSHLSLNPAKKAVPSDSFASSSKEVFCALSKGHSELINIKG